MPIINISKPLSHPGDEWKPRKLWIYEYIPNKEDNIITQNDGKRKDKNIIENNRLKHKKLRLRGDSSGLQWTPEQIKDEDNDLDM